MSESPAAGAGGAPRRPLSRIEAKRRARPRPDEVYGVVPDNIEVRFAMREVIGCFVDGSLDTMEPRNALVIALFASSGAPLGEPGYGVLRL